MSGKSTRVSVPSNYINVDTFNPRLNAHSTKSLGLILGKPSLKKTQFCLTVFKILSSWRCCCYQMSSVCAKEMWAGPIKSKVRASCKILMWPLGWLKGECARTIKCEIWFEQPVTKVSLCTLAQAKQAEGNIESNSWKVIMVGSPPDLVVVWSLCRCSPKTLMVPNPHSHRHMRIQLSPIDNPNILQPKHNSE